ncbi:sigma-70 family RNA polymerase sigma factor [Mucilaginibacter defluvii]|uniref:RNA polymerase sigma factor (Sigma-70 family) n=1 Tax=Mucilaginibacter defluvii TaxID=1196019 RepID=A0ABP9FLQ0_9SPHI
MQKRIGGTLSESEVLVQFTNGNETALRSIYNATSGKLIRQATKIVGDNFTASCIVQEAFLKAWELRERMRSILHVYRFLRLTVTWKCYAWLNKPANRFSRTKTIYYGDMSLFENSYCQSVSFPKQGTEEQQLDAIGKVLLYLPVKSKDIFDLYFSKGYSYRKIAERYGRSVQGISADIRHSVAKVRQMIQVKSEETKPGKTSLAAYDVFLQGVQLTIFRLRYEQKQSFECIANTLALPLTEVQRQYVRSYHQLRKCSAL